MRQKIKILAGAFALLASAGSLAAQEADTTAPAVEAPAAEAPADEAAVEGAPAAEAQPAHDWEFALYSGDLTQASGKVMVTENEDKNDFVVVASGLPPVDSLDQDDMDVNAYTVWIVPGRDKVIESVLAGVLLVSPDGGAHFEGSTDLENFGVAIAATSDGAPSQIARPIVLSGIPKEAETAEVVEDVAEEVEEVVEEAADTAENVAEEVEDAADGTTEAEAAEAAQQEPDT
ncbi:MAG TPA: hypothetical protein VEY33_07550, partial [Gemmatimonadota bacterium]|nr:hypothetical protein [Gemmatimonadota bacterium]